MLKMKREIIKIDEDKCNGCGLCIPNCHEGALQIIDGKARLISDLMCDGLGACIGHCPEGALEIEVREAEPCDEVKVMEQMAKLQNNGNGCPGIMSKSFIAGNATETLPPQAENSSELTQWPVQMHLINPQAAHFRKSDLLLAADCVAYAMGNFHGSYLKGKSLAIACPKLDSNRKVYLNKLVSLINDAEINTITVMKMEVPCCSGIQQMAVNAVQSAKRKVPVKSITVGIRGEILSEQWL